MSDLSEIPVGDEQEGPTEEAELTAAQECRQDAVDNACHNLLCILAVGHDVEWDMEHIGAVREAAQEVLVDKLHLMTKMEFYPYIELEMSEDMANKQEYLANNGVRCLYCGSDQIEAGTVDENEEGIIVESVKCLDCHKSWSDVYRLVDAKPWE